MLVNAAKASQNVMLLSLCNSSATSLNTAAKTSRFICGYNSAKHDVSECSQNKSKRDVAYPP